MHEELHLIEQGGYVNQDLCTLPKSITWCHEYVDASSTE